MSSRSLVFLRRRSEEKRYGTYDSKPDGSRNRTAEKMLQTFKDSGHPIFRCTRPLERGQLRSKGGGIRSHFGSRAISCSNVHGVFPVHELFWFCLVQVSTTQFCSFSFSLMARVSDGTNVPISPAPASFEYGFS